MITRLFLYRLSRCQADGPSFAPNWVSGIVRSAGHGPSWAAVAIPNKKSPGNLAYNYLRGLGQPGGRQKQLSRETSEAKEEIANPFPVLPRLINGEPRKAVTGLTTEQGSLQP